ncbi:hypothetical protein M426DRAFT_210581 [Hypoxylon sp. CI-4A]|nr:hypothetical protein M426DRAFT_210581 [Hypoxylon sp. CI-4A]
MLNNSTKTHKKTPSSRKEELMKLYAFFLFFPSFFLSSALNAVEDAKNPCRSVNPVNARSCYFPFHNVENWTLIYRYISYKCVGI